MSESTSNLTLPYIQPSQAQKHVTHNEALQVLDALVQASALDRTRTSPPAVPNEGDRYIVPVSATGDWAGQDATLAVYANGGWMFHVPNVGWKIYVEAEGAEVVFDGAGWAIQGLPQFDTLGLNAQSDSVNRLAISAPATLLTHEGAGHQLKVNKATIADTNSLLFQTNFAGRAEMGCTGNDDFSIKVSEDGTAFHEGLVVQSATGAVQFPNGIAGTGTAAGQMGGQILTITSGANGPLTNGSALSFGDDAITGAGVVIPFEGVLLAATVSIAGGPIGSTTLQCALNQVANTQYEVSATYSGTGVATGVADFSATPLVVAGGTSISMICSNTVGAENIVATAYMLIS